MSLRPWAKNTFFLKIFFLLLESSLFLSLMMMSQKAMSCASCGSGGGDPLILYPNEAQKIYAGLALQDIKSEVSTDSKRGEVFGPKAKSILSLSYGLRLNYDLFGTLTSGYQRNFRDSHSDGGFLDPSLFFRYTLLSQSFATPYTPQIQGLLGYKHAAGRSIHNSKEKDLVDITSSGFSDLKIGLDIWYGMFDVKGGLAYLSLYSLPRQEKDGAKNEAGMTHRWTGTLAYQLLPSLKITSGINRQTTEARRYKGVKIPQSTTQDHSLFINIDFIKEGSHLIRANFVKTALLSSDQLTTETNTWGLAYLAQL